MSRHEMILHPRKAFVGSWRPAAISALALILVAAASEYDASFERLRQMPADERTRLLANLREFDLRLTPEQQASVRDLDRKLAALSPDERAHYLSVLRRYHAWVNSLPEPRQNELAAKPPAERRALIRAMIGKHPVPAGDSPPKLRVIEPGEYNAFEVASAYRIWQLLTEKQKADLGRVSPEHARREALFRAGSHLKDPISRETPPPDFELEKWVGEVKDYWSKAHSPLMRAIATLENVAKGKTDEAVKRRVEVMLPTILRRQAINLYVNQTKVRPVDSERLSRFIAALPPWIPSTFDSLSPDEARRRMIFAYRLVFPGPEEIGAARKPAAAASKPHGTPAPRAGTPAKAKRKPAEDGEEPAPF